MNFPATNAIFTPFSKLSSSSFLYGKLWWNQIKLQAENIQDHKSINFKLLTERNKKRKKKKDLKGRKNFSFNPPKCLKTLSFSFSVLFKNLMTSFGCLKKTMKEINKIHIFNDIKVYRLAVFLFCFLHLFLSQWHLWKIYFNWNNLILRRKRKKVHGN